MELKEIYGLWDRFEQSAVAEMELEFQGMRLHLKKEERSGTRKLDTEKEPVNGIHKESIEGKSARVSKVREVKAPMVGVFYQAPSPDSEPFVKPGQEVKKGDVIGIIEAMKCMNEITAQENGTVQDILVKDSELVEYDQVLLTLLPAGE